MLDQLILRSANSHCDYQLNPAIPTEAVICAGWIFKLYLRFPVMRSSSALATYGFDAQAIDQIIADDKGVILRALLQEAEQRIELELFQLRFEANFAEFCKLLSLREMEQKMFRFALLSRHCSFMFEHIHAPFYIGRSEEVYAQVACCIDEAANDIENMFEVGSALKSCNLVKKVRGSNLAEQFFTHRIFSGMFSQHCQIGQLLAVFSQPAMASTLAPANFSHLHQEFRLLDALLKKAVQTGQQGCNFLIYGPPGTGKTELARLLTSLNVSNVQEINANRNDESLESKDRLNSYQICQRIYANNPETVIIFDEADDVIPSVLGLQLGHLSPQKLGLNKLLESNPRPCFWLCNNINNFDPAMLRRFTQIVMLDIPPAVVRLKMASDILAEIKLEETWLERLCLDPRVTPAMLRLLNENSQGLLTDSVHENQQLLESMLNPLLVALDGSELKSLPLKTTVNIEAYNADHDLNSLLNGLQQNADLKICLYGPPGTGKSSFAAMLATKLKMPLVKIQASSLLGSFVGETEKAIAKAFRQARQQNAVLLFDEVDTFLLARDGAQRHWHKTMVNELLSQLDDFSGLFLCTTNFIEQIDKAALRRLDLKIKLDYLTDEQCSAQLAKLVSEFGIEHSSSAINCGLHSLTPADFMLAKRKLKQLSSGTVDLNTVIECLLLEQNFKSVGKPEVTILH